MTERPNRFILQAYHPEYACPAFEMMFSYELPLLSDERKKLARFHDEYPPHGHGWEEELASAPCSDHSLTVISSFEDDRTIEIISDPQ